ncbi:hypothetical protein ABZ896_41410 [Streptomyces sp. NPDC047072]|uniref:hypothetical protein n=1 Tax=Streptomyces sp. NPDC047072 TaxID=3154809 RepID=UPI0033C39995
MIALFRYTLSVMLHSQRYMPPLLLFVGVTVVLTGSSGPATPAAIYGPVAGVLFVCSTWLTVALVNSEDPVRRVITVVHAGSSRAVLVGTVLVALAVCLAVSGVLLFLPLVVGGHALTPYDVLVGFLAQLTGASTGVAIGLVVSRLVIRRIGHSLIVAFLLLPFFAFTQGMPPINRMIRVLANSSDTAADLLPTAAGCAVVAVGLLTVSMVVTDFVAARRD